MPFDSYRKFCSMLHAVTVVGFVLTIVGYLGVSSYLQYNYYVRQSTTPKAWKVQPLKTASLGDSAWWFPLLSLKKNRPGPNHAILATINLLQAAVFQALGLELSLRKIGFLWYDAQVTLPFLLWSLVMLFVYMNVAEYYWHRLMHVPYFYKWMHKIHHYYKSPEPFDDLYIYPLEQTGFMTILHFPSLIVPLPSYLLYILMNAFQGMVDHSGIDISFPIVYDSKHHDEHHRNFRCNYSFLSPIMDILHGTFSGEWAGMKFKCSTTIPKD